MSILLIGVGYFPFLTAGEKNFFFHLLPILKEQTDVSVLSLNDSVESVLQQGTAAGDITVYCARRPFHRNYGRFHFRGDGYTTYHHRHKPSQEIVEKSVSIVVQLPRLRRIIHQHKIQVVHFMDNFGPVMPLLGRIFPHVKVTYSAANYEPRGRQSVYDAYLRLSIGFLDGAGVYTQAYLSRLREIGIRVPLRITRWGVPEVDQELPAERKRVIRQGLGIKDKQRFFLWSGYLQQIQERDFYRTVEVARQVVQAGCNAAFVFAFKPETFRPEYVQEAGDCIQVVNGVKNFRAVLETADLFLSPIGNSRSTVSPPLTWLEAMSMGTPVITTAVGGVDEVITSGQTGYVASSYDNLVDVVIEASRNDSLATMSRRAREFVRETFNIQRSAEAHLQFWREMTTT